MSIIRLLSLDDICPDCNQTYLDCTCLVTVDVEEVEEDNTEDTDQKGDDKND